MDPISIQAAYTGLRYAIDALRTVVGTRNKIEADARIADTLDHLGRVQDTLFELRNQLAELQAENLTLKSQLTKQTNWEVESAQYGVVETNGGAVVYRTKEPPMRYACPKCYGDQKIQFLQDMHVMSGEHKCPDCKVTYPIDGRRPLEKLQYPGGTGGPNSWMGN